MIQLNINMRRILITITVERFDPAINYGPNDAGISAITILLGIISIIIVSWLFGKIYAQIDKLLKNNDDT